MQTFLTERNNAAESSGNAARNAAESRDATADFPWCFESISSDPEPSDKEEEVPCSLQTEPPTPRLFPDPSPITVGDLISRPCPAIQEDNIDQAADLVRKAGFAHICAAITAPLREEIPEKIKFAWWCSRCRFSPNPQMAGWAPPLTWGGRSWCWNCVRYCPICTCYAPVSASLNWQATTVCKVCYVSISRTGYPPNVTRSSDISGDDNGVRSEANRRNLVIEREIYDPRHDPHVYCYCDGCNRKRRFGEEEPAKRKYEPTVRRFNPDNNNI